MSIVVLCPHCKVRLTLGDDRAGDSFECPKCDRVLTVPVMKNAVTPKPRVIDYVPDSEPEPVEKPYYRKAKRKRFATHRGGMILTFGLLSLLMCAPIGIFAWVMGQNDLAEMDKGRMDPSGRQLTQAGYVCGIIGTLVFIIPFVIISFWILMLIIAFFVR